MATDIQFSDLTNATTPTDGTGYFDKLLSTINIHINDQYNQGRLTGTDYASVYLGSMQSAISQSLEFLLKEKLIEAQTDGAISDAKTKEQQSKIAYIERIIKDKEAVKAGLDKLNKTISDSPEDIYTPKYETV